MDSSFHDADEADEDMGVKYELRPQSRSLIKGFTTTWIDQDDTGDYDPREELRKERARRARARLRDRKVRADNVEDEEVRCQSTPSDHTRLVAQITFKSEASKAAYRTCVENLPLSSESGGGDLLNDYILRSSRMSRPLQACEERPRHIPHLPDDLTGHPIARGCWECLSKGQRCPLLDDEHAWPCSSCTLEDHDCDLVTPPTKKQACERCKRRGAVCSYSIDTKHQAACQQCDIDGYRCVAGPAEGSVRSRIRLDRDYVRNPSITPQRAEKLQEIWTCMQCREAGRQCSFSTGGYGDDCQACEAKGNICFPERTLGLPSTTSSTDPKSKQLEKHPKQKHKRTTLYQSPVDKRVKTVKSSKKQTITTKFCHPIGFNHEDQDGLHPCHFCDDSSFPLFGLGERKVEVTEQADGCGWRENSGGHASEGAELTRMCMVCTMDRVAIITCDDHLIQPIPGVSLDTLDYDGAFTAVFDANTTRKNDRWCSLCLDLAIYECAAPQATEPQEHGCGLALCEQCNTDARKAGLQAMLEKVKAEDRELGWRADWDLLKQDGLIMQYVRWVTRQ